MRVLNFPKRNQEQSARYGLAHGSESCCHAARADAEINDIPSFSPLNFLIFPTVISFTSFHRFLDYEIPLRL